MPNTVRRASLTTVVSETLKRCATCGSRKITCERTILRWLIDLKYYKTGIGVKKWQPRYLIRHYQCRSYVQISLSPNVSFDANSRSLYGHGLICWCVYHNIVGKQPMLQVHRGLRDIFGLNIPSAQTYRFKTNLASHYKPLCEEIHAAVLRDNVLHVDETPVKLRKTTGYVWVLSSATKVYYLFKDSREGTFLHDLLGTYQGILVSDFFTAYDSLKCRQQKCLIHLMRDINDDLRRNPYDEELRSVAEPFATLLKEIVLTIDRYGLRRLHLHKHVRAQRDSVPPLPEVISLRIALRSIKPGSRNMETGYSHSCTTTASPGITIMLNTQCTTLRKYGDLMTAPSHGLQ